MTKTQKIIAERTTFADFQEDAKEIHIRQTINGENDIEFDLPNGDDKWAIVGPGRRL